MQAATAAVIEAAQLLDKAPSHCIDALLARAQPAIDDLVAGYGLEPHDLYACPDFAAALHSADSATARAARSMLADGQSGGAHAESHAHIDPLRPSGATGRAARDDLADVFGPIAHDMLQAVRAVRDAPLDSLPRYGTPIVHREAIPLRENGRHILLSGGLGIDVDHVGGAFGSFRSDGARALDKPTAPGLFAQASIGEYGPRLAAALVEAARIMNATIGESTDPLALNALAASRRELLERWVFQGMDIDDSMVEGINTFVDVYTNLLARTMPGKDVVELLDEIETSGIVDRMGKMPFGVIAPLSVNQLLPLEPLAVGARGRLVLGPSWDAIEAGVLRHQATYPTTSQSTGAGCPLSIRLLETFVPSSTGARQSETFIAALNREYVHLVKRLLTDPGFRLPPMHGNFDPVAQ